MKHGGDIYSDAIEYDFSINLNPMDCTDVIKEIMEDSVEKIYYYPDSLQREFRKAVALMEGVSSDEVYGGNGASEILRGLALMINPSKVLMVTPSFTGYRHALLVLPGCEIMEYELQVEKNFVVDSDFLKVLKEQTKKDLDLLILTNPNNPTGKTIPAQILVEILKICKENNVKLIIDECFIRMSKGSHSLKKYINDYNGLFVVNAFTKLFSIPGIRVGYVLTDKRNIAVLERFLPEWNMSTIAQSAGVICSNYIREQKWVEQTQEVIEKEREYLTKGLKELGFRVVDSDTVFVLFYSKENLYEKLKNKKILIRDCSNFEGLDNGFYRVAVKNHHDNELLLQALKMRNE